MYTITNLQKNRTGRRTPTNKLQKSRSYRIRPLRKRTKEPNTEERSQTRRRLLNIDNAGFGLRRVPRVSQGLEDDQRLDVDILRKERRRVRLLRDRRFDRRDEGRQQILRQDNISRQQSGLS